MNAIAQLTLSCVLGIGWVLLNVIGIMYILRRRATRMLMASVVAVTTIIYGLAALAVGLAPNTPQSWALIIIAGLGFFIVTLLWTYWGPLLRGTTWEDMVRSAQATINKANKHDP